MAERKIGLVIGTNNYKDTGMKLNFAEDDAKAMKEILLDRDLCGFDDVIELIDRPHSEVLLKIENLLKKADQSDTVLVYFSGHGKLDNITGELHFLFKDTEPESLLATSISFDFINRCIKHSNSKTIIMIIDSCYSGAAGLKGGDELHLINTLEAASGEGRIILSASDKFQPAKENPDLQHGVFTNFLLDGLKTGVADTDEDGFVSIGELYNYASSRTKQISPQTPIMKGEFKGNIIIGNNPKKRKEIIFNGNIKKLIEMSKEGQLEEILFYEAINIVSKNYENPSTLTDIEREIKPHIEHLLAGSITSQGYSNVINVIKAFKAPDVPEVRPLVDNKKKIEGVNVVAQQLFDEEKYSEAIDKWKKVLNFDPENKTAKDGIKKAEEVNKKQILFSRAELTEGVNYFNIAYSFHEKGDYVKAIENYDKAIELNPNYEQAWNNKGWSLSTIGRHEEAIPCYDKAIEIDPNFALAWDSKGWSLGALERHEEAIVCCDKAIEIDPNYTKAWNRKGWNLGRLGRHEEAIPCYDKALEIDPTVVEAWHNKGWSLEKLGRKDEAERCFKRAKELGYKES